MLVTLSMQLVGLGSRASISSRSRSCWSIALKTAIIPLSVLVLLQWADYFLGGKWTVSVSTLVRGQGEMITSRV